MNDELLTSTEQKQNGAWRIAGLSLMLGLFFWGWFAHTLSPIQRYYFSAYVGSSLHRVGSHEPDQAVWILKTGPKDRFEIADTADLVPALHSVLPFALSSSSLAQGWTGTSISTPSSYPAGSLRPFLRQDFFTDRSLLEMFSLPLQLLSIPLAVWFSFVYWKRQRDQERDIMWVQAERIWFADIWDFSRDMAEAARFIAVSSWRWARKGGSVSPSAPQPEVLASQVAPSQPTKLESETPPQLTRAQTLPFRKRQAAEAGKTSDESK